MSFSEELRDQFNANHIYKNSNEPQFGLMFDIDGVLARGLTPLPEAIEMFNKIKDSDGNLRIPTVFLTNSCSLSHAKANLLRKWFGIKINNDQLIQAQSPLKVFNEWHDKNILFVGQENTVEIAKELGFKKIFTLDHVKEAYPLLDIVDHSNRKKIAKGYVEKGMVPIEAIILLGEPKNWESYLQLLIDLLVTNGKPDHAPESFPKTHLPIVACNMDLVFKAEAKMPRYGHGAFLICLETLYQKVTGHTLTYTSLVGKPSEISYRFAEHILSKTAKEMGINLPIKRLYFFGDNPIVDILGSNLYNNYIKRFRRMSGNRRMNREEINKLRVQAAVSSSRGIPPDTEFLEQTATKIESILVHTGVYKPDEEGDIKKSKPNYCHRDFIRASELDNPMAELENCLEGLNHIIFEEGFSL